ncbi:MAG: DUF5615 family PIN-like protein [Ktedonobacteraceae bacterium]|nr:DUF5615 family PIN-like protein [Ktedonobacteraceae bacterium]
MQQREINRLPTLLLDENIPRKVLVTLRQADYTAMRVYDVGLRAQPDTAIFAYARAHRLLIITFDTDYLNQMAFPPPHAGILVLRAFPRGTSVAELATAVLTAVRYLSAQDCTNRVYRLEPDGVRDA